MKYDSKIVKMPEIVALLVETFKEEYLHCSKNSIKNIVLAKMAQVITAKRVRYKEFENLGFPNYYAINLLPSGFGKDKMVNDIDRHILPHFYEWFQNEAEEYNLRQIGEIKNIF